MAGREIQVERVLQAEVAPSEIDIQIATAHRYPRDLQKFKVLAEEMATGDEEIAGHCIYAMKRRNADGSFKEITGPSVRLAEIIVSAWGNTHAAAKVGAIDEKFVTAQSYCWDLERNVRIGWEIPRRITTKDGKRYSDDMIMVTASAAESIAYRNAAFKVIPQALWKPIEKKVRTVISGAGRDAKGREEILRKMLAAYATKGITLSQVLKRIGKRAIAEITPEDIVTLRGIWTAIEEGMTSLETEFLAPTKEERPLPRVADELLKKPAQPPAAPVASKPEPPPERQAGEDELEPEFTTDVEQAKEGDDLGDLVMDAFAKSAPTPEPEVLPDLPPPPKLRGWPKGKLRKPPAATPNDNDLGPSRDTLLQKARSLVQECIAAGDAAKLPPDFEDMSPSDLWSLIKRLGNRLQVAKQASGT